VKIKTACLLLSLFHFGSAAALGLGELKVRSYLGQPLHATVALVGTTPNTTADCFSLESSTAAIAPLVRTKLSIEQSGSHAVLHIRTPQAINDPIAQFVLVSDCEARLKRDYVILLDPPAQLETVTISRNEPVAEAMPAASAAMPKPRATRKSPRNIQRARAASPRLATSASRSAAPRVSANASSSDAPRLVLSGKHGSAVHAALALRLDTTLPDLTLPRPEPLTATEMSDENTALTRKLAHLETQLASLQQRNLELEAQHAATAPRTSAPAAKQPAQWPLYLLAVGLLAGAGLILAGLRLRSRSRSPIVMMDDTAWTPPDAMPPLHEASRPPPPVVAPKPQQPPEMAPLEAASTEVKDDILDQAEVYMAHGHGELAVHLLQEHLRVAPDESPVPWLLLLDLLQREGDTAGYAAASAECRRYFNVNLSSQGTLNNSEEGVGLEAYPLLLEELVRVWKTPDASAFFDELIYDKRGGTRIGFEPHVYRDILMLRTIADQDSLAA
jgi:Tfp pilus assembly protein FimV